MANKNSVTVYSRNAKLAIGALFAVVAIAAIWLLAWMAIQVHVLLTPVREQDHTGNWVARVGTTAFVGAVVLLLALAVWRRKREPLSIFVAIIAACAAMIATLEMTYLLVQQVCHLISVALHWVTLIMGDLMIALAALAAIKMAVYGHYQEWRNKE